MEGFASSNSEEAYSRFFQNPKRAANLVCHVLMLNAWRHRRNEVHYLQGTIDCLSQQIKHLHLQIVVLRRLLDAENNRVNKLISDVHRNKMQFDETMKERNTLKTVILVAFIRRVSVITFRLITKSSKGIGNISVQL